MFGRTKRSAPVEPAEPPVEVPAYEQTWNRISTWSKRNCSIRYSQYGNRHTEFCACGHWGYEHAVFSWGTACLKCGDRSSSEGE